MSEQRLLRLWGDLRRLLAMNNLEIAFSEGTQHGNHFECDRSARSTSDMHAFCVNFDPKSAEERTDEQLISDLLHEYFHMALYSAWEAGQEGRREPSRKKYIDAHESGVHDLERAIAPLVVKAWRSRLRKRKKCQSSRSATPTPSSPASPSPDSAQ